MWWQNPSRPWDYGDGDHDYHPHGYSDDDNHDDNDDDAYQCCRHSNSIESSGTDLTEEQKEAGRKILRFFQDKTKITEAYKKPEGTR